MPVYEYQCTVCGERTQRLEQVGENSSGKKCLSCGKGEIKKVFSVFGTPGSSTKACYGDTSSRFT